MLSSSRKILSQGHLSIFGIPLEITTLHPEIGIILLKPDCDEETVSTAQSTMYFNLETELSFLTVK